MLGNREDPLAPEIRTHDSNDLGVAHDLTSAGTELATGDTSRPGIIDPPTGPLKSDHGGTGHTGSDDS